MTRILIGMLSLALVGVGGLVAAVDGFGEDRLARSVSIPAGTTTDGVEDVSGPCDEAEHADDPRCTGVAPAGSTTNGATTAATTTSATTTTNAKTTGATTTADISGPCDEAEHADDPRCTGGGATDADDDRSGSDQSDENSGRGGADDNSGHGSDDRSDDD